MSFMWKFNMSSNQATSTGSTSNYDTERDRLKTVSQAYEHLGSPIEQAVRRRVKPFAISAIEAECPGVSRDMVRHVLRRMRATGEIANRGRGRGAQWVRLLS